MRVDAIRSIVRYKPDILSWKATSNTSHIIGINISGVTYHDLGHKHLDVYPDYIYFFNQKDDYNAYVKEVGFCYSVHFTTTEPLETESFCKKINNPKEVLTLIEKLDNSRSKMQDSELKMLSDFYKLCDTISRLYRVPYTPKDIRIFNAKEYIDLHFKEKNCFDIAVDICGITKRRFNDIFKLNFNTTPNKYITAKKIDYAKELLYLGCISNSDISDMCGFTDVYYFSKVFKQEMGVTPAQYKKMHIYK